MVTYVMEAKENYDPANVALINANTPPLYCCADQQDVGMGFDFGRRMIKYAVIIADADSTTNNTGFTLWDGKLAYPPLTVIDTTVNWNLWTAEKNIDTGAVTFYNAFNVANLVPAGAGGYASGWMKLGAGIAAGDNVVLNGVTWTFVTGSPVGNQTQMPPVYSWGAMGLSGITNGQNIVLNGVTWTFVTGSPVGNQTQIQGSDDATVVQLVSDLNASVNASIDVASYFHDVGPAAFSIIYKTPGTAGNSYTVSLGTCSGSIPSGLLQTGFNDAGAVRQLAADLNASANASINVASYSVPAGNYLRITYKTQVPASHGYTFSLGTTPGIQSGPVLGYQPQPYDSSSGGFASGWINASSTISNTQFFVINGVTWTFVTGAPSGNQTQIQGSTAATIAQLVTDLNASVNASIDVASYFYGGGSRFYAAYKTQGLTGNSFTLNIGNISATLSAATLTGGYPVDGTMRRMVFDTSTSGGSVPVLTNPRTNDLWVHVQSCNLYLFRHSDNFEQTISPLPPIFSVDSPVYPIGITSDWMYAFEEGGVGRGPFYLYLIPSTLTSDEIAADYLLAYAEFDYPGINPRGNQKDLNICFFRQCLDHSGNFYIVSSERDPTAGANSKNIRFWKFTKPTSAPFGGPVVGGGFSDITPWTITTGPNTHGAAYTTNDKITTQEVEDRNILMFLPATSDFVAINKFTQYESTAISFTASITGTVMTVTAVASGVLAVGQAVFSSFHPLNIPVHITSLGTGSGGTGTYNVDRSVSASLQDLNAAAYTDTFYDCTYVNVSGAPTFDYHHAFVTGFMDASWTSTVLGSAAYAVNACTEFNLYLGMSDFDYGVDYTKRWFLFSVQPVAAGVITYGSENVKTVLVEYQFVSGAPPVVLQVIDDQNWTSAYPDYAAAIDVSSPSVVWNSTPGADWGTIDGNSRPQNIFVSDILVTDPGLFDYSSNSWWMSGFNNNMYYLDSAFTPRASFTRDTALPPFLRLSAPTAPMGLTASTNIQVKGRLVQPVPTPPPPTPPPPTPPNPFNCLVPVISQYANSPILLTILENFCEAVDPFPLINEFYNYLWNIETARGYGLDVWGRIVGVTRVVEIPAGRFFGHEEQLGSTDPYNSSPFFAGFLSGEAFLLSDDAFRLLILVKALANITDGSVKSINTILRTLFEGDGNAYVADGLNMTMAYTFEFPLTAIQAAVINQSGVLPRSIGVSATVSVPV